MSKATRPSPDAYLAHDTSDSALAWAVADRLRAAGLTTASVHLDGAGTFSLDSQPFRRELFESFTLVVVLTPAFVRSGVLPFYLGVADATASPVYVLNADVSQSDVPDYLQRSRYFTEPLWEGLPRVVDEIAKASQPLDADAVMALEQVYQEVGVPADQLVASTTLRREFAQMFAKKSGASLSEFRLLRELIRLRKRGKLPRLKRAAVVS
jgi:hypothetical protein